jgi:hypothetical protein
VPRLALYLIDGGGGQSVNIDNSAAFHVNDWHVGIAVIERATGKARIGTRNLATGATYMSTEDAVSGSVTTTANFTFGSSAWVPAARYQLAAAYIGTGSGAATGMSANLSTALANFAEAII